MVSNDRSRPLYPLVPTVTPRAHDVRSTSSLAQTASFQIADAVVELAATPASVTLTVARPERREVFPLDHTGLERWADATARLLGLQPARDPSGRAEFRAPFLMDLGGRPALAFEAEILETVVAHRLVLMSGDGRVETLPTSRGVLDGVIEAARGAVDMATASPTGPAAASSMSSARG